MVYLRRNDSTRRVRAWEFEKAVTHIEEAAQILDYEEVQAVIVGEGASHHF